MENEKINIGKHLVKDYWVRRVLADGSNNVQPSADFSTHYRKPFCDLKETKYRLLTQEDFMNEIAPSAHDIMSSTYSKRPVYAPTGEKDEATGKEKWAFTGYDNVETVSLGLQNALAIKKASHFAGKGFWIASEKRQDELYQKFISWKDRAGLMTAYMDVVLSCFKTGDGAIYLYQRGNDIEYKVFSRLYGDMLYTDEDKDRKKVVYRQYWYKGKNAVDIFSTTARETWVQVSAKDEEGKKWLAEYGNADAYAESDDGYVRIYRSDNQVGNDYVQVIYFRVPDIPSGVAQDSISALERALSYVAEEVKSSAFPMLFVKAMSIKALPPTDAHGKVVGVTGDPESLKNSDAKYLAPPNASDIATLHINKLVQDIIRSTMTVFIEPDILKQGSDSSTTIKILFVPELQWCQMMWVHFYHPVKELVEVFKRLVGKVEGNGEGYSKLFVSVGLDVWLPQNEGEIIDQTCKMVYAGILSQENAANEIGLQYIGDMEKIKKEAEDKLYRDNYIPTMAKAKAEAEYGTPPDDKIVVEKENNTDGDNGKPKLDKNLQRRDLAEEV